MHEYFLLAVGNRLQLLHKDLSLLHEDRDDLLQAVERKLWVEHLPLSGMFCAFCGQQDLSGVYLQV